MKLLFQRMKWIWMCTSTSLPCKKTKGEGCQCFFHHCWEFRSSLLCRLCERLCLKWAFKSLNWNKITVVAELISYLRGCDVNFINLTLQNLKSFTCLISISSPNPLCWYKLDYDFNGKHDELKSHPPQFEVSSHILLLAKDPKDEFSFSLWKPNSFQRGRTPNASTCCVWWAKWSILKRWQQA